jgi:thymidylate synthase
LLPGNIPVLVARGRGLAETWEKALIELYEHGADVRTEYDRNTGSRPSKDATMMMVIEQPDSEPLIHRAFPGGLEDLEEYRQEVLDGIKDHWVRDPSDPTDQRWEYTYHERLFAYRLTPKDPPLNQMEAIAARLAEVPYTRRAQAVTWKVWCDPDCYDPPCLQSLWFRILDDDKGVWRLNMNIRFRSRDAYDAAFMNCFAFIALQERIASQVAARAGREVKLGRYVDLSDSFHIYGRRLGDFESGFLKQVRERSFEDRTWTREFAEPFFEEARPKIKAKVREVDSRRPPKPSGS